MKKTKKLLGIGTVLTVLLNNTVYATNGVIQESEGFPSKYMFMGVALIVVILLLFLGYRMDSKGDEISYKPSKKSKKFKKEKKSMVKEDIEYKEDTNVTYESDNVNVNDLTDEMEYVDEEYDESSLFATENEFNPNIFNNETTDSSNLSYETSEDEIKDVEELDEGEFGEVFDTSIIDGIEDEEDIVIPESSKISDIKAPELPNKFDETMIFNNMNNYENNEINIEADDEKVNTNNLVSEIDSLDNLEESDPFIESLKNFKEPETDFEGFSVAEPKEDKKKTKKYIKAKKEEIISNVEEDFLSQMEANLGNGKEENKTEKTTTRKSTSRKKKEE